MTCEDKMTTFQQPHIPGVTPCGQHSFICLSNISDDNSWFSITAMWQKLSKSICTELSQSEITKDGGGVREEHQLPTIYLLFHVFKSQAEIFFSLASKLVPFHEISPSHKSLVFTIKMTDVLFQYIHLLLAKFNRSLRLTIGWNFPHQNIFTRKVKRNENILNFLLQVVTEDI